MRYFFTLTSLILLSILSVQAQQDNHLLIQHATLIHPSSGEYRAEMDVLIKDGRIAEIARSISGDEEDVERLDGTGKFLTVGFTDGHIHFFQNGGLYTRPDAIDLRALRPYEQELALTWDNKDRFLKQYLAAGITMVCDVGGPMKNYDVRDSADLQPLTPEVRVTGPLISTYAPTALMTDDSPIIRISTPEEARELVQKQIPRNPDFIKIWFIVFPGQSPDASSEIVKATIEEAHLHEVPVAVHATQLETARLAVKLGADILVHSVDDKPVDEEFIQLLVDNEVSYIPTLIVSNNYEQAFTGNPLLGASDYALSDPHYLGTLMDMKHIPERYIPTWIKNMPVRDNSPKQKMMASNLKILHDAGVNVVFGTDAGNIGTLHAGSFYTEWGAMQEAGLSSLEIYRTATINAGMMMEEGDYGALKEGQRADLVLWDRDPFGGESICSPEHIITIIKDGLICPKPADLLAFTPEDIAQKQLNAYNARNLEAFLDCYSDSVKIYNYPGNLMAEGKDAMRQMYGPMFDSTPDLHCELVNRIVIGNKVIDEELVDGFGGPERSHAVAIYEINDGLIQTVSFMR